KECSMDLECAKKSPKSTCNIFTLKCNNVVDDKKSTTTAGKTGTDGKDITKGIGTETTSISRKITRRRITTKNSCVDLIPDGPNGCSSLKKYCNDENYKQFLSEMCPKTCGKCFPIGKTTPFPTKIPIGVIETCKDSGPDCEKDIALCSSKVYKDLMKRICRKSCNYC
uniref:ShKT domain-containing protein n=1 Tax=Parastrongyloides trichosuri TaxID=131310 RepID=A0A0N4ZXM8_PARTI